jgi:hypothetical protein
LRPGLTLLEAFDADVSGRDFAHGKPDPEMFLAAAEELAVRPMRDGLGGRHRRRARRRPAAWLRSESPAPTTPACLPRPARTSW